MHNFTKINDQFKTKITNLIQTLNLKDPMMHLTYKIIIHLTNAAP